MSTKQLVVSTLHGHMQKSNVSVLTCELGRPMFPLRLHKTTELQTYRRTRLGVRLGITKDKQIFDEVALSELYSRLSADTGVTVRDLRDLVAEMSIRDMSTKDLNSYRQGRKPWKKLRDEVVPVCQFLSAEARDEARVRFPLDDQPPDAWLNVGDENPVGIEVTGALARSRVEVLSNLADNGIVPGFVGLQDNATNLEFKAARDRGRILHSPAGVNGALETGIKKQFERKDKPKYGGMILLVTCGLQSSPGRSDESWQKSLSGYADKLPFTVVYLVDSGSGQRRIRLK